MYSLISDFVNYLKKPVYPDKFEDSSVKDKLIRCLRLLALTAPFSVLAIFIGIKIWELVPTEPTSLLEEELMGNPAPLFFAAVVFAPIIEEIVFRVWLNPVVSSWSIFFGYLFSQFLVVLLPLDVVIASTGFDAGTVLLASTLLLTAVVSYIVLLIIKGLKLDWFGKRSLKGWRKRFWIPFYFSVFGFGLIHVVNFEGAGEYWYLLPALVLPQIIAGLELGYLRCRYGFWYGVFGHFVNNLVAVGLASSLFLYTPETRDALEAGEDMMSIGMSQRDNIASLVMMLLFGLVLAGVIGGNIYNIIEWNKSKRQAKISG